MKRVLLVDDEPTQARALRRAVAHSPDLRMDDCRSGRAALCRLRDRRYEVVVIDWVLEDMDGIELGRRIRTTGHDDGLIMLTGCYTSLGDERRALDEGFDDFLRKPCDLEVLLCRVRALARRAMGAARRQRVVRTGPHGSDALADAALEVAADAPEALVYARRVSLTKLEWKILRTLYASRGSAVGWARLGREAYPRDPPADLRDCLDHHLRALRKKVGPDGAELIETVRGVGVRLNFRNRKSRE